MKPKENIEEFVKVRKPVVTTSGEMDRRTLDDSLAAMEHTMQAKSAPSTVRIMIKLTAAAAVLIVAFALFLGRDKHPTKKPAEHERIVAQSSAKITSMVSLRTAYQRGGIDALDKQFKDTLELLGPQPLNITMNEMLNGVNGI
jgi:Tfp pilus assembly protein PilO